MALAPVRLRWAHLGRGRGRGRRLVDKYQPVQLLAHVRLPGQPPASACLAHIIASAFRCHQRFFYI